MQVLLPLVVARYYDKTVGRWWGVDALAEADEDFSPYLYTSNNPVLNIDLFGLTDVNGDGKDDGTILPQVTVIAQRDESTLNNIQLTLDGIGLYPGAGTLAGVVNAGIDIYRGNYGSAGLNLLSAVPVLGTDMKGTKLAVMGTKAISSMAKMKVMKAAIPLVIRRLKPAGTQLHHIIPKGVYKDNAAIFDQLKNFDIDNIGNLIPLNKGFHGNHPAYSEYVAKELTELATQNGGKLTIQHITQTVDKMEGVIQKANNSSSNLNDYIRTLK
ncbi:AHH domain-containing protein [Flectobacillus major]|uniref:AHH domain-containing protein n=1 Tax=Flectobacillus major TaxID=103 RepID=UPI0003FF1C49|nr:AHH domain-containing protein [Flectobacillus major]